MKNYLLKKIISVGIYPLLFILVIWIVFFIQQNSNYNFSKLGVLPRSIDGLPGIVTSIFIHGDLDHIASNTLPILVLGMLLFFFYKKIAKTAFLWIWIISGIWLWIGGRNNSNYPIYHIGASTMIYGLATFLFFSGVFRKHLRLMVVSALVVFLYGSIMWGIFPLKEEMSWEGHLFGALAGVLVAYNYRKEGPQQKVFVWEEEEEETDYDETQINFGDEELPPQDETNIKINYIYKNNPFEGSDEEGKIK